MAEARMRTTYSMWRAFRDCRKLAYWRYVREIVPRERRAHALGFGSVIHGGLETWHRHRDPLLMQAAIDAAYPRRAGAPIERADWHLATAMMRGYAARYPAEDFEVVALEQQFEGDIINPETGAASRSFTLAGKVDGIVRVGREHFLLENKTAAVIDGSYLERLWTDFQITLYTQYVEQALHIRVAGVLYNVLVKAKPQQGTGETEEEFEARRAALAAKSKSGRTTAKRRMPESDEAFQARLAEKYADPSMFHRERLFISRDQLRLLQAELWELTQAFLDARRRNVFYQNTSHCFQYGRPCPYFALCRSGDSEVVLENLYEHRPAHEELEAGSGAIVALGASACALAPVQSPLPVF